MSNSACPNETEYVLVSDITLDNLAGVMAVQRWERAIQEESPAIWKCWKCGTLHLFGDTQDKNHVTEVYVKKSYSTE
jgi:hypothetical protein